MKVIYGFFASKRYWADDAALNSAYHELTDSICKGETAILLADEKDLNNLPKGDCFVAVPMSGAVQRDIVAASKKYTCVVIYAAYIRGNASEKVTKAMLLRNAAPTVMDTWAVLRRTHPHAMIALNQNKLDKTLKVINAFCYIQGAKIVLIGSTEPWVISTSADVHTYEKKLGVVVEQIPQSELAKCYRETTAEEGKEYYDYFSKHAKEIVEPTQEDIMNASRMSAALIKTLKAHNAQGGAIACFNLLSEGTNMCLGVSYINDCTDMTISCEGDMDSAVTMMMVKKLTSTHPWMANPGLQPNETINFSHCSAPICATGKEALPCTLRNHHESGIGVSLQIDIPVGTPVTACRISDDASKMTIHRGVSVYGDYECACRTQMYVKFDEPEHYLKTALGCHQTFAFENIQEELTMIAELFGLEIL